MLLVRVWQPAEVLTAEPIERRERRQRRRRGTSDGSGATDDDLTDPNHVDTRADVARAYAPYLVIIAIFSITNITAVKEQLAKEPWTKIFAWPGLDVLNPAGDPVATTNYTLNWLPAAGTLMIFAGIITALILRVGPGEMLRTYGKTYVELSSAIVTVMAVLACLRLRRGSVEPA